MKEVTIRGLDNAMHGLMNCPEMDRIRLFLVADASADKSEADEIILAIVNGMRDHLLAHGKQVRAIAAARRVV